MIESRSWAAQQVPRSMGKIILVVVVLGALAGVLVPLLARENLPALQEYMPYAGLAFVLFYLVFVSRLLGRKGKPVTLTLDGHHLVLGTGKRLVRLNLRTATVAFGRHYAARNYAYFTGTMLHLRSQADATVIRLLGGGVEFPTAPYEAPESYGSDYEAWLGADPFHDLVETLRTVAPDALPRLPDAGSEAVAFDTPQRYEAFPAKGRGTFLVMALWMGGMVVIGLASAAFFTTMDPATASRIGPWVVGIGALLLIALVTVIGNRAYARKGHLVLARDSLSLELNGRVRHQVTLPLQEVRPLHVEVRGRYGSHYAGPALELRTTGGRVRLLLSAPERRWASAVKTVGTADYTLGVDAGDALFRWLAIAGVDGGLPEFASPPNVSP
jgi:hypothetical protein